MLKEDSVSGRSDMSDDIGICPSTKSHEQPRIKTRPADLNRKQDVIYKCAQPRENILENNRVDKSTPEATVLSRSTSSLFTKREIYTTVVTSDFQAGDIRLPKQHFDMIESLLQDYCGSNWEDSLFGRVRFYTLLAFFIFFSILFLCFLTAFCFCLSLNSKKLFCKLHFINLYSR